MPLAIASIDEMKDPRLLAAMAARQRVTRMVVVPSLLRTVLELQAPLPDLTLWLATSEELTPALVRAFRTARPTDRLVNLYGASETADQVAAYDVADPEARTPIGKPIANSRIYVVDEHRAPVPIGVAGELCIAGVGLSRYTTVNHADGERFTYAAGERVYRTGDRGRWRHDGVLEYLGRLDHVLKIRGVRVDPAEVEAAILAHGEIADAVVTAQPGFDGEARLVAHVVARGNDRFDAGELRRRLRARLPETMIPTAFVAMPALPLGPTGKVDRAALPAIAVAAPSRAPETATEHAVALAGELLLGIPVGAENDVFAAGGQSLVAAQLGARLAERFGVELPLPVLFERPTVAAQAAWIDDAIRTAGATTIPHADEPAPLSFAQERLWFAAELAPDAPAPKLRSALRIDGPLDADKLRAALDAVADPQAIRAAQPCLPATAADPARARGVAAHPPGHRRDRDRRGVRRRHRQSPPRRRARDPVRSRRRPAVAHAPAPVLAHRSRPARHDAPPRHRRHLARAVARRAARGLRRAGRGPRAGAAGDRDHGRGRSRRWQRRAERTRRCRAGSGATHASLPAPRRSTCRSPRPRTAWSDGRGGRVRADLSEEDAAAVSALARAEHTSVFGVLVAGAAAWLHGLTGRDDLVIGTIAAGRDRPEVRPLIGLFLNPLPLRLDAAGDPSLRELVAARGRHHARGARPLRRAVRAHRRRRQPGAPAVPPAAVRRRAQPPPARRSAAARRPRRQARARRDRAGRAVRADDPDDCEKGPRHPARLPARSLRRRRPSTAWLARYVDALRAIIAEPDRTMSSLRA